VNYAEFIERKLSIVAPTGLVDVPDLGDHLFPFQADLVQWALRRGRAAIFASTGLGKTRQELTWASEVVRHTDGAVLILAPLAVAAQTAAEAARIGIDATVARDHSEIESAITITNYDRLHKFTPSMFAGVVLDESSIIKHHEAKTLKLLIEAFSGTDYRLCATATPAPNDYTELGTHAEFLGICTRSEMLAEFFCHDGGETQVWRLKGHARAQFWRWVASWGALVRSPADLGYDDGAYRLPPLNVHEHIIAATEAQAREQGRLFAEPANGLTEQRRARKATLDDRVTQCAAEVNASRESWIVWCGLNRESEMLTAAIDGAVEVTGSQDIDAKEASLSAFARGEIRVLVTKCEIAGFGLNFQHCSRMAFVGVSHSWEKYYQAVRRCWRFGQTRPVDVHIYAGELEGDVVASLKRKEADAAAMAEELSAETAEIVRSEVRGMTRETNAYAHRKIKTPRWLKRREAEFE
jgi:superfamily II DNA or RNA helicase